jgi:hypothetical protein
MKAMRVSPGKRRSNADSTALLNNPIRGPLTRSRAESADKPRAGDLLGSRTHQGRTGSESMSRARTRNFQTPAAKASGISSPNAKSRTAAIVTHGPVGATR